MDKVESLYKMIAESKAMEPSDAKGLGDCIITAVNDEYQNLIDKRETRLESDIEIALTVAKNAEIPSAERWAIINLELNAVREGIYVIPLEKEFLQNIKTWLSDAEGKPTMQTVAGYLGPLYAPFIRFHFKYSSFDVIPFYRPLFRCSHCGQKAPWKEGRLGPSFQAGSADDLYEKLSEARKKDFASANLSSNERVAIESVINNWNSNTDQINRLKNSVWGAFFSPEKSIQDVDVWDKLPWGKHGRGWEVASTLTLSGAPESVVENILTTSPSQYHELLIVLDYILPSARNDLAREYLRKSLKDAGASISFDTWKINELPDVANLYLEIVKNLELSLEVLPQSFLDALQGAWKGRSV